MFYILMFVTALILVNVFKWNLIIAAVTSVIVWGIIGGILSAVSGNTTSGDKAGGTKE